jgi:hypothetical protein
MREQYHLTPIELRKFNRIPPFQNEALGFWSWVARSRGLDPETVISESNSQQVRFTALPIGHGKAWCYPMPLKCKKKPNYAE